MGAGSAKSRSNAYRRSPPPPSLPRRGRGKSFRQVPSEPNVAAVDALPCWGEGQKRAVNGLPQSRRSSTRPAVRVWTRASCRASDRSEEQPVTLTAAPVATTPVTATLPGETKPALKSTELEINAAIGLRLMIDPFRSERSVYESSHSAKPHRAAPPSSVFTVYRNRE